jgi:hypothetical protein
MKTMFRALTITLALSCASIIKTLAQDEPPAPPPPVAIIHGVQNLTEGTVHMVQNDVEKHMHDTQQRIQNIQNRIFKIRSGSPRSAKSLVIRSSDMAPREQSDLEEDMTIMAHILDKALAEQSTDDQAGHVAMGISVSYAPGEGPTRNLYLDGYGAVFFLNVNFPLLPPPAEKNVEKERAPADSTWEEARAEVYGQPGTKSWASRPEYDGAKVAALKKALLDSLKNAANIRSVRSDESITVCVIGAPSRGPLRVVTGSGGGGYGGSVGGAGGGLGPFSSSSSGGGGGGGEQNVWVTTSGNDDAPANKTTLTIRAKKTDCEAFAKGKLTADEFRNRATITIYGEPAAGAP